MLVRAERSFRRMWAPLGAALALAAQALAQGPDVAKLAPAQSFLVVGVQDFTQFRAALDKSELGKLWAEPSVQAWVEKSLEKESERFTDLLKGMNIDRKDLKPPTGHVGLAMFLPKAEGKGAEMPDPHMLGYAELGENAASWDDVIEKAIEHGVQQKDFAVEEDEYAGAKIRTLTPSYEEPKADKPAGGDEDMGGDEPSAPKGLAGFIGGTAKNKRSLHLARTGNTLFACTDRASLEGAIDAFAGKHIDAVDDVQAFHDAADQRATGELAYGTFLVQPLLEPLLANAEEKAKEQDDGGPKMRVLLDILGVANVKAVSAGLRLYTDQATSELSMGVLVPEKKGLLALFNESTGPFTPPAFVPGDAGDFTRFKVNFAGIWPIVKQTVDAFPEDSREMVQAQIAAVENIAKPALEALGPSVQFMTTYKQPLGVGSSATLFAIDVKDQGAIQNTISFLSGQAPGMLEPRDFEGNTIYSANLPMGEVELALGVGFNKVFIGPAASVENAMRLAGHPGDSAKLADEPRFRSATSLLSGDAVVYSFTDVEQALRWAYWESENADKILEQQAEKWGLSDEDKEEYLKSVREAKKDAPPLPPMDTVISHFGDTVAELRPTPDGFRGRTLMLKPRSK